MYYGDLKILEHFHTTVGAVSVAERKVVSMLIRTFPHHGRAVSVAERKVVSMLIRTFPHHGRCGFLTALLQSVQIIQ